MQFPEEAEGPPSSQVLSHLHGVLSEVMLRRSRDVLGFAGPGFSMPRLRTHVVREAFRDPAEKAIYDLHFSNYQTRMQVYEEEDTVHRNYMGILTELTRMRQACNHPDLGEQNKASTTTQTHVEPVVHTYEHGMPQIGPWGDYYRSDNAREGQQDETFPGPSTKIEMLVETLKRIRQKDPTRKTIVFSTFTSMLNKAKIFLEKENFRTVSCKL